MKNKGVSQMSRVKIKKLSTGVQSFALTISEKLCTPNNYMYKKIKKEKRKKDFPALKAGKGSTPETTPNTPNLFLGCCERGKSKIAGVGLAFCVNC